MKPIFFTLVATCLLTFNAAFAQTTTAPVKTQWAFPPFVRADAVNPIISPDTSTRFLDPMSNKPVSWEGNYTFNPAAAVLKDKVVVLYRAEDLTGDRIGTRTSRIGYAESEDGIHFRREQQPVLYPGNDAQRSYEWPGGCEDPRVAVTEDGTYVMLYTQWNRQVPRLGAATSRDLKNWQKTGPIFAKALAGKFLNIPSKSASILTTLKNGRQVIKKINGVYWMYWGEYHVYAATSVNLTDWTPLVDEKGNLRELASPRKGYFDSGLTECGPPAIYTDKGIVLLYNGKNAVGDKGDRRYAAGAYCAGQFLFDKQDPARMITRLDTPFLYPQRPYEKSGQYKDGTVFIEGMIYFKHQWFLYYGCADSRVSVAVYDPK
ncbi:hypothetical protein HGH93_02070 [Chitinophaga polysaccharea]|uniref:glycoside hydrolase family 130 protein n=1 Tax=Chitinophaga TaxID=79328 RepID=UPI0014554B87|nr:MULTISPECIES: glycoside hydrolase family 130 protein [Chitinophaga]NLR56870.1 hypothetical protein [Chitinophaga polysaccharea]NLU93092.1 hypothetical protein [Chitinophaga sp. Ak27]